MNARSPLSRHHAVLSHRPFLFLSTCLFVFLLAQHRTTQKKSEITADGRCANGGTAGVGNQLARDQRAAARMHNACVWFVGEWSTKCNGVPTVYSANFLPT
nr:hypothetical protein [Pandoravirus belohorizontensis]